MIEDSIELWKFIPCHDQEAQWKGLAREIVLKAFLNGLLRLNANQETADPSGLKTLQKTLFTSDLSALV